MWMCLIQYDECIKDCDKAVEKDRKLRPGKEQLEKVSTGSRQERLVLLALLLLRTPSPLMRMCSPQSCDQSVGERGLSLKLTVWIGGNPVEGNVETELESLKIERRVCYLATKGSERMRFETCPSKKIWSCGSYNLRSDVKRSDLRMASPFCWFDIASKLKQPWC